MLVSALRTRPLTAIGLKKKKVKAEQRDGDTPEWQQPIHRRGVSVFGMALKSTN